MSHRTAKSLRKLMNFKPSAPRTYEARAYTKTVYSSTEKELDGSPKKMFDFKVYTVRNAPTSPRAIYQKAKVKVAQFAKMMRAA